MPQITTGLITPPPGRLASEAFGFAQGRCNITRKMRRYFTSYKKRRHADCAFKPRR